MEDVLSVFSPRPAMGRPAARPDRRPHPTVMQLQVLQAVVRDTLPLGVPAEAYDRDPLRCHEGSKVAVKVGPGIRAVLLCVDEEGHSVAVHVENWEPAALARVLRGATVPPSDLARAVALLRNNPDAAETGEDLPTGAYHFVRRKRLFDFHVDYSTRSRREDAWLAVRFPSTKSLRNAAKRARQLRDKVARGQYDRAEGSPPVVFAEVAEHAVAPESKLLDELGVAPSTWVNLLHARPLTGGRIVHAHRELVVRFEDIVPVERDDCAPFAIASVDIECRQGADGSFPRPVSDPIICIGTVVARCGREGGERVRSIHALRDIAAIDGAVVEDGFDSEVAMLDAFRDFIVRQDVCMLLGYNLWGFDYKYMVDRYNHLQGAKDGQRPTDRGWLLGDGQRFPMLSRFITEQATARPKMLASAALGHNQLFEILSTGRCTVDLLIYMKANYKLSRYTLNAVATQFVGDQKEDIAHADIYRYFDGTPEERKRYCTYCIQDCALPIDISSKLAVVLDYVQTSRVQWTQLADLVSRGQQIRVFNMLHRYCHSQGYVIDREPQRGAAPASAEDEGYEGATVLPPTPGFYQEAVATLDFASLYPSIMRAHNLCYSTRWADDAPAPPWLQTEEHEGCTFVTDERFRGVLPSMLDDLLRERKATKRAMARETDPVLRALLDKKQQAQKVSANSVYGFTGAVARGMYPCRDVAKTTTGRGRDYIARTREIVVSRYQLPVIYGDTDSVMVNMRTQCVEDAFQRAEEMGGYISAQFPEAIVLEFEKVYMPYLLHGKKRYVGCKFEDSPTLPPKMDCKGIEMVRRDNAPCARAVQKAALTRLVMNGDAPGAIEEIRTVLAAIVAKQLPHSEYVITKALAAEYKSASLAHVHVAEKMRTRGLPTPTGGRIEFVITRAPGKLFERAEDAVYAERNRLQLDREYYLDKQIMTPLRNLLGRVFDLAPLFDAALAEVRTQDERGDRRRMVATLGVSLRGGAEDAPTDLRTEAGAVVDSLTAGGESEHETRGGKRQCTLARFLQPVQ